MSDWMQRDLKNYDATGRQLHTSGLGLICFGTGVRYARAFAPSALIPVLTGLFGLVPMCIAYYRAVDLSSKQFNCCQTAYCC